MVKLSRALSLMLGVLATGVGCQAILGIDDKQLDPKYSQADSGLGGGAGSGGTGTTLGSTPPERPSGAAVPSGSGAERWFAARRIYLGSVDPATDQKDPEAWRRIGHDIDGECTTMEISSSDSSATCAKPPEAPLGSLEDGEDCRDNTMGAAMAVGLAQLSNDFELQQHAKLENAETGTYLLRLDDLDDGPDDPYVRGAMYVTVPRDPNFTAKPVWNGQDRFAVDLLTVDVNDEGGLPEGGSPDGGPTDASAPDAGDAEGGGAPGQSPFIDKPVYVFDKGYLKNNVWVSGDFRETPKTLPLFVLDRITEVETSTVTLVAELTPTHDGILASQLSAAVATPEAEAKIGPIALELAFCLQVGADYMMNNFILPRRDLGNNPPTFRTPGVPCYTFSIGWAFKWEPVKPPLYVAPGKYKAPVCGQ